jgi:hypothetical protein
MQGHRELLLLFQIMEIKTFFQDFFNGPEVIKTVSMRPLAGLG